MVIFVGGCPPKHLQDNVKNWGSPTDYAGYAFQTALIAGLDKVCEDIRVITYLWIVPFPSSSKIYLPRESFSHKFDNDHNDVFIGFINIPIIKRLSLIYRTLKELLIATKTNEDVFLINYALSSSMLIPISILHKRFKRICQIVPDLPEYMSENRGWLFRIGKKVDKCIINKCLKNIDCFALLSLYMKEKLPIKDKPCMQLEGIYNPIFFSPPIKSKDNKKIVMYSGALGLRYGIKDLVEAFVKIQDPSFELWICGSGNGEIMIKEEAEKDMRIKFFGVLEREKVLEMQRQATVLVNPRHKTERYTKYSFPSKTMEYLASGTPVIMSHLDSIPPEYDEHIFYFEEENVEGIQKKIEEICNMPPEKLMDFGQKASKFILSNKTSEIQGYRLYSFMMK